MVALLRGPGYSLVPCRRSVPSRSSGRERQAHLESRSDRACGDVPQSDDYRRVNGGRSSDSVIGVVEPIGGHVCASTDLDLDLDLDATLRRIQDVRHRTELGGIEGIIGFTEPLTVGI